MLLGHHPAGGVADQAGPVFRTIRQRRHFTTSVFSSGTIRQVVYGMYSTFCSGTMMATALLHL